MIAMTIAALITVIAIATVLTLVDFWLRGKSAYAVLRRQSALVKAGFVPQVEAQVVRLRPVSRRHAETTRLFPARQNQHHQARRLVRAAA